MQIPPAFLARSMGVKPSTDCCKQIFGLISWHEPWPWSWCHIPCQPHGSYMASYRQTKLLYARLWLQHVWWCTSCQHSRPAIYAKGLVNSVGQGFIVHNRQESDGYTSEAASLWHWQNRTSIADRDPKRIVRCDSPPRYIYHSLMIDVPESLQADWVIESPLLVGFCRMEAQSDIGNL